MFLDLKFHRIVSFQIMISYVELFFEIIRDQSEQITKLE